MASANTGAREEDVISPSVVLNGGDVYRIPASFISKRLGEALVEFMTNKAKDDELVVIPFVCYEEVAAELVSMLPEIGGEVGNVWQKVAEGCREYSRGFMEKGVVDESECEPVRRILEEIGAAVASSPLKPRGELANILRAALRQALKEAMDLEDAIRGYILNRGRDVLAPAVAAPTWIILRADGTIDLTKKELESLLKRLGEEVGVKEVSG